MKTIMMLVAVLATGCATAVSDSAGRVDLPFKEYIAPDGTRTWSIYFADSLANYYGDQSEHELIARQMAWSRLCESGYTIDRVETVDDGRVYYGSCR